MLNAKQTIAVLKAHTFYVITVKFKHANGGLSDKSYSYKVPVNVKLMKDALVIVKSPYNGFVVCVVDKLSGMLDPEDERFLKSMM